MLSNAYFLAKLSFDTAENEPAKNLQKFANLPILLSRGDRKGLGRGGAEVVTGELRALHRGAPEARKEPPEGARGRACRGGGN